MRNLVIGFELRRKTFSLLSTINLVRIRRALRHYNRPVEMSIAIVVPEDENFFFNLKNFVSSREHFISIDESMIDEYIDAKNININVIDLRTSLSIDEYKVRAGQNFACMYADNVLHDVCAACDAVIFVDPISTHDVQVAIAHMQKIWIDDDKAGLILEHLSFCDKVFSYGRPFSRAYNALLKFSAIERDEDGEAEVPKPSEKKSSLAPEIKLEKLHGYGDALEWGLDLARDLKAYKDGSLLWDHISKGLLLSGPPGCGKTTYAKALAAQCGVPLICGSYGEWAAGHGQTDLLKKMRETFKKAAKSAPCILFIDEVDSFPDRDSVPEWGAVWERQIVNGLLELIDGTSSTSGIVVVGACNNPSIVDPALKRPGRLDHHIEIPLPDDKSRLGILKHHLKKAGPLSDIMNDEGTVVQNLRDVIERTEGCSAAEIEKIVRDAAKIARKQSRQITSDDLVASLPKIIKFSDDYKYYLAVHEIGHAVAAAKLGLKMDWIAIADSVRQDHEKKNQMLGVVKINKDFESKETKQFAINTICMKLAASAAEEIILGEISSGRVIDLSTATELATLLEVSLGYGRTLISDGHDLNSKELTALRARDEDLRDRVHYTLEEQMSRARQIIREHKHIVIKLAKRLASERKIDPADVVAAVNGLDITENVIDDLSEIVGEFAA